MLQHLSGQMPRARILLAVALWAMAIPSVYLWLKIRFSGVTYTYDALFAVRIVLCLLAVVSVVAGWAGMRIGNVRYRAILSGALLTQFAALAQLISWHLGS